MSLTPPGSEEPSMPGAPTPADDAGTSPVRAPGTRTSLRDRIRPAAPLLDAFLPGLGHLVARRRRLAVTFGIPTVLAIGVVALLLATTSLARLAAEAVNAFAVLFLIQGVVLVWRLLAVSSSLRAARTEGRTARIAPGRPSLATIAAVALLAFVVLPQAWLGYLTNVAREEVDRVFAAAAAEPTPGPSTEPEPSFTPDPSALTTPEASLPVATAPPAEPSARVNVLLLGIDSGVGRNTALTDTMIVASLDPELGTVSMVSIPRDMVGVPLPDGRRFNPKVNGLHAYARHNPRLFAGSDGSGNDVLMGALGTLLGLEIKYYASVNLPGFVKVVDSIGGVDVRVTRAFCDPTYDEYGFTRGFAIAAGWHHLNGQQALAYARVRKASGESDFTRAARQQEVIAGLRDGIVRRGLVSDPVALLRALGQTLQTNVPRELLPDLADMMTQVDRTRTFRAVIEHPLVDSDFDERGSIQVPDLKGIRALAARLFPTPGLLPDTEFSSVPATTDGSGGSNPAAAPPTGRPLTSGVKGCAPAPTPTPRRTSAPPATSTAGPTVAAPVPTPSPKGTPVVTAPPPTPGPTGP